MTTQPPASRSPGRPTIMLIAPQGAGKTLYSRALTQRLGCTHCIDDGETVNGQPIEPGADIPTDGALVLVNDDWLSGGDLTIVAHTQAGFDALVRALGIPLSHRPPYAKDAVRGYGDEWPCKPVFAGTTNEHDYGSRG